MTATPELIPVRPLCRRCAGLIESLGRPVETHDARDVVIVS